MAILSRRPSRYRPASAIAIAQQPQVDVDLAQTAAAAQPENPLCHRHRLARLQQALAKRVIDRGAARTQPAWITNLKVINLQSILPVNRCLRQRQYAYQML